MIIWSPQGHRRSIHSRERPDERGEKKTIEAMAMDMWEPFIKAVREEIPIFCSSTRFITKYDQHWERIQEIVDDRRLLKR